MTLHGISVVVDNLNKETPTSIANKVAGLMTKHHTVHVKFKEGFDYQLFLKGEDDDKDSETQAKKVYRCLGLKFPMKSRFEFDYVDTVIYSREITN